MSSKTSKSTQHKGDKGDKFSKLLLQAGLFIEKYIPPGSINKSSLHSSNKIVNNRTRQT